MVISLKNKFRCLFVKQNSSTENGGLPVTNDIPFLGN